MKIARRSFLQAGLVLGGGLPIPAQSSDADALTTAATGDPIPHPLSKKTYFVESADSRVEVPQSMVYVAAGRFTMGERQATHDVYLDGFAMAKYLVTNAEYNAFADATQHRMLPRYWSSRTYPEGKANQPVLWVSWNDAQEYCAWVSKGTGHTVALPTEAQWERAARGPQAFLYPWGNDANPRNLNFNGVCAAKYGLEVASDGRVPGWLAFRDTQPYHDLVDHGGYTTPVGAYPQGRSYYGCYDMGGNAWQWCSDWYMQEYYRLAGADRNPHGPDREHADEVSRAGEHGKCKVIRGGSWYAQLTSARSVNREETRRPEGGYHSVGFRVIATGVGA
jgi:formylglycine-generating enzyme required for sulfatase activity